MNEFYDSAKPNDDAQIPSASVASAPLVGPPPVGEPPSPSLESLRDFWRRTALTDYDRERLWRERGLTAATAEALGFRSNLKRNLEILLEMKEQFPMNVLLDSGLWKYPAGIDGMEDTSKPPVPNAQFYGMALVQKRYAQGKKVRNENGELIIEPVWGAADCPLCRKEWCCPDHTGPILIPYFDAAGELIHLRPHKGMMKDRAPRFYIARPNKKTLAANPQASARAVGVGAVPGITMAKLLLPDIEEWLEGLTANQALITEGEFKAAALYQELDEPAVGTLVRSVVVAYDNENKRDPQLPGYQEEDWKQLEVEVWSRFLANLLTKQGFEASVGYLPDAWRDAKGKADWDGRLSSRLRELNVVDYAGWQKHHPKLRSEFLQVLKQAVPVRSLWQAGLFDSKENRLIQNRLERLSYERMLPIGGEDEETIVRRLRRLIARLRRNAILPSSAIGYLNLLAKSYQNTKGCYYILKKLSDKSRDQWEGFLQKAGNIGDTDLKRACELVLFAGPARTGGNPECISDFYLKAHYCLLKTSGERIRLVSLHNVHGVHTKTVRMPSADFAQPSKFREWLLNSISGATWRAGERELQALQQDIARDLAKKEIEEVTLRGYHAESKCWFYADVVYLPDGSEIFADKDNVVWVRSKGGLTQSYTLADKDHESQDFCQGAPKMHPKTVISDAELRSFFEETAQSFYNTQGSYAAFLSMGSVLATYAGPEIFAEWNACASLWVHGQSREGKSCYVRWLLRILGFNIEKGMPLADSTKVGISIALQQYGESMIWLEEFQPGAPGWLIEKLKNIHDRGSGIKKTYDEDRRVIRSGAIVTGIATSTNAQLKSRYIHVQVAKKNRKMQLFDWFQKNSPRFYLFGRHCLRNRSAFAKLTLKHLREFIEDPNITGVDERARIVHGAAYAAFAAFNELLGSVFEAPAMKSFREFTVSHGQESERSVNERMNISEFWRDVLDALGSNDFCKTQAELQGIFKVVKYHPKKSPVSIKQMQIGADHGAPYDWISYKLYFRPGELLDKLRKHKRQRGDTPPLDKDDLLNHMKVQPYWEPASTKSGHKQTFQKNSRHRESCWCILIDAHELGLLQHTDDEFEASLYQMDEEGKPKPDIWLPKDKWVDPRKGELFAIVEAVMNQKDEE